ncbi:hypothetical protein [Mycobacterium montefiorense]|uniref:hypothetical protein n=1 Tax=Mycobacterium montefiorense TaxID=154654 RepID=UPI0021F301C0|nr:hypothetical protein [Mycobacterium montefiorense]MCV7429329.1 hypothetical protein [Mycobacterium montefiorense]
MSLAFESYQHGVLARDGAGMHGHLNIAASTTTWISTHRVFKQQLNCREDRKSQRGNSYEGTP